MQKVVIITGASSGIGLATAKKFLANGFKVYGVSRHLKEGLEFENYQADINDNEIMSNVLKDIFDKEGRIDVLVNNAGFGIAGPIEETKEENIKKIIDTNLTALINLCAKTIPYIKMSGGGRIINISSVGGIIPLPFQACYSATKSAVEIFSRALATELKPFDIKVTAILPGDTKTEFTTARVVDTNENSAYEKSAKSFISKMEKDEQNGKSPDYVAKVIYKVATMKRPPLRKSVGLLSKAEIFLTRMVSTKLLNYIVKKIYD